MSENKKAYLRSIKDVPPDFVEYYRDLGIDCYEYRKYLYDPRVTHITSRRAKDDIASILQHGILSQEEAVSLGYLRRRFPDPLENFVSLNPIQRANPEVDREQMLKTWLDSYDISFLILDSIQESEGFCPDGFGHPIVRRVNLNQISAIVVDNLDTFNTIRRFPNPNNIPIVFRHPTGYKR